MAAVRARPHAAEDRDCLRGATAVVPVYGAFARPKGGSAMKKILLAVLAGAALGVLANAATSWAASGGTACGPNGLVCSAKQECCMSPHPFTFRCVAKGTCQFNN
jgi:hypothetical protein